MAQKVEFTKEDTVNGEKFKKGDTKTVSNSIFKLLTANGSIKKPVVKKES